MYPIRIVCLWICTHACNLALSSILEPRWHASVARLGFVEFQQAVGFTAVVADVAVFPTEMIDTSRREEVVFGGRHLGRAVCLLCWGLWVLPEGRVGVELGGNRLLVAQVRVLDNRSQHREQNRSRMERTSSPSTGTA